VPSPKILLIDIDGLRPDVFRRALADGHAPNLARLLGDAPPRSGAPAGYLIPAVAPAPSITFCSQACLFTGAHPAEHGIPGNQFFDRFGTHSGGVPRHYAFDVGDTLAVDDAVRVFTGGLAADRLRVPTIYEQLAARGMTSVAAGNMYARGAGHWIKPSLSNIGRFTRGGSLFGMDSRTYDQAILDGLIGYWDGHGIPDLSAMYFMGLDHDSHAGGPEPAQFKYLTEHVDPMIGEMIAALQNRTPLDQFAVAVFSDHGQIAVPPDDAHALKIGFPFDREMGHLFHALRLDVHDFPGEDPACDAVLALNGGLAAVYLQHKTGHWRDAPRYAQDVLPVARAFWDASLTGKHAPELRGALAGVLARNVERDGWRAPYEALTPEGHLIPLGAWFSAQPPGLYVDPVHRLDNLAGEFAGDVLLISQYAAGYYFGGEVSGVHGGLHPADSLATLAFGGAADGQACAAAIARRCAGEGGRMASTADLWTGLQAILG
jgi:hypothetical protein